jgi:hypothetical protein
LDDSEYHEMHKGQPSKQLKLTQKIKRKPVPRVTSKDLTEHQLADNAIEPTVGKAFAGNWMGRTNPDPPSKSGKKELPLPRINTSLANLSFRSNRGHQDQLGHDHIRDLLPATPELEEDVDPTVTAALGGTLRTPPSIAHDVCPKLQALEAMPAEKTQQSWMLPWEYNTEKPSLSLLLPSTTLDLGCFPRTPTPGSPVDDNRSWITATVPEVTEDGIRASTGLWRVQLEDGPIDRTSKASSNKAGERLHSDPSEEYSTRPGSWHPVLPPLNLEDMASNPLVDVSLTGSMDVSSSADQSHHSEQSEEVMHDHSDVEGQRVRAGKVRSGYWDLSIDLGAATTSFSHWLAGTSLSFASSSRSDTAQQRRSIGEKFPDGGAVAVIKHATDKVRRMSRDMLERAPSIASAHADIGSQRVERQHAQPVPNPGKNTTGFSRLEESASSDTFGKDDGKDVESQSWLTSREALADLGIFAMNGNGILAGSRRTSSMLARPLSMGQDSRSSSPGLSTIENVRGHGCHQFAMGDY